MRLRMTIFGTVGTVATLVGVALLVVPAQVRQFAVVDRFLTETANVPQTTLVLLTGMLACGYVVLAARSRTIDSGESDDDAQKRFEALRNRPPEAVTAERQTRTAAGMDDRLEKAVSGADNQMMEVRATLRTLATQGNGKTDRQEAIRNGNWTSDPVAAAFLAGPAGPEMPVSSRLRLWLTPERERRRRIERTLAVIEEQAGQP